MGRTYGIALVATIATVVSAPRLAAAGFIDHFATYGDIGTDKAPNRGVSSILVLPVIVSETNLPWSGSLTSAASRFYSPVGSGFTFSNYYDVASLGRYTPVVTVEDVVPPYATCPFTYSNGRCTIERGDITALLPAIRVVREVLDTANASVDFRDYDVNGASPGVADGVIDGIILLTNIDFGGIALPHWRICKNPLVSVACALAGLAGWNPTYDGVLVPWVAIAGARNGDVDQAVALSVHEFGHLLGLADLYDESGRTTDLPYSVMGGWSYEDPPQLPDAFSRYVLGWGNPVQIAGNSMAILRPAHSSGDLLKLGTGTEFFLAEYRQALPPWDGDIFPAGVAITHINLAERPLPGDQSYTNTILNCVNCETWSPMVMLEQADGLYELELAPDARDDAGDLFGPGDVFPSAPDHLPLATVTRFDSNRYDGTSTGIAVTVESVSNVAVLNIQHPTLTAPCADLVCPFEGVCTDGTCDFGDGTGPAGSGGSGGSAGSSGSGGAAGVGGSGGAAGTGGSGGNVGGAGGSAGSSGSGGSGGASGGSGGAAGSAGGGSGSGGLGGDGGAGHAGTAGTGGSPGAAGHDGTSGGGSGTGGTSSTAAPPDGGCACTSATTSAHLPLLLALGLLTVGRRRARNAG